MTKIYDFFLYIFCYVEANTYHFLGEVQDFRKNFNWIKLNGPYKGKDLDGQ